MNLHTAAYRPGLLGQCVDLMGDTWNLNGLYPGLRKENLVNELFFREAILGANHAELVVDDQGRVHGYLFGFLPRSGEAMVVPFFQRLGAWIWAFLHLMAGSFGPRLQALGRTRELLAMTGSLEALRRPDDAYVCLFFVGSTLRGLGWGKRLMDSFSRKAEQSRSRRIYLWTDKGCNFHFYEHTGFQRIREISSVFLAQPGQEPNGFVYARELTRQAG
jgi:ribosomal protein S18 acetylase RimI-like enzyme